MYKRQEVAVIGIAKNPRNQASTRENEIFRGRSSKPLYISCEGIALLEAKELVQSMDGPYRIPRIIKLADTVCRKQRA